MTVFATGNDMKKKMFGIVGALFPIGTKPFIRGLTAQRHQTNSPPAPMK